jgi:D-threo-aldose 1-dehydrogenase
MPPVTSRLANWPLPTIALGTGAWQQPNAIQPKDIPALVEFVLSQPNPAFDTAPLYGSGDSETWLGAALRGVPRDSYRVTSKAGWAIQPGGASAIHDFTRDGILRSIEGSLERLGLSYLDIAHIHDADDNKQDALDVAFPTLCELRDQGVVRAVGSGMNQWQMLAEFAQQADVDCFLLAGRYTLLEQTSLPLLKLCQEKGLALFLGGVYNSGILATGAVPGARFQYDTAPAAIMDKVRRLQDVCARHGVALPTAALQFPLAHPAVRTLVIGANSIAEFTTALNAVNASSPAALWADLRSEGLLDPGAPVPH